MSSLSLDIIKGPLKNHCCIHFSPLTRAECNDHCAKEPKLNNLQVLCPLFLLKFCSWKRLEDAWIMWGLFACEGFVIPNPFETTLYFHTIKFPTLHFMSQWTPNRESRKEKQTCISHVADVNLSPLARPCSRVPLVKTPPTSRPWNSYSNEMRLYFDAMKTNYDTTQRKKTRFNHNGHPISFNWAMS